MQLGKTAQQRQVTCPQHPTPVGYPIFVWIFRKKVAMVAIECRLAGCRVGRSPGAINSRLEEVDVDANTLRWSEKQILSIAVKERGRRCAGGHQGAPGVMQKDAQVVASSIGIDVWPERLGYLIPVQAVGGLKSEQFDDGRGALLPPSGVGHRLPVDGDAKSAQKMDIEWCRFLRCRPP